MGFLHSLNDYSELTSEFDRFGAKLAEGQTIFHGGDFGIEDLDQLCAKPLSTTFKPLIAIWHAYNDGIGKWDRRTSTEPPQPKRPAILVLTVARNFKKRAIIFRGGGPSMADEMEAIMEPGCRIAPISSHNYSGFYNVEIIQATLEG